MSGAPVEHVHATEFGIGDVVDLIDCPGRSGRVDALMLLETGWQYRVVHWHDGSRREVWVYGWEIRKG